MKKSRPDSYQPPYPAYQSHFASGHDDFVMAMASVQARQQSAAEQLTNELLALLLVDRECKPLHVERGTQTDASGYHNDVFMPYWKDKQDMHGFWEREDVQSWMSKPRKGDAGWWRETIVAPVTSLDGNYSLEKIDYGVGRYVEQKLEQFHAYFGSMRDRVVDYLSGEADGKKGQITRRDAVDSFGRRMRISEMPDKLCFIRGPFGWDKATEEEQQAFIDDMLPVFKTGADYLRDNPLDSNCISMRFIDEVDMGLDNGVQVEILAWFLTLKDLERWTHHHPTHLAIYRGVFEYMKRFDFQARLNLGHEVIVVPSGGAVLEYCNCHPSTGFLPFFESVEIQ